LPASHKSLRTTNPIRAIVDPVLASVKADTLSLALGDPTAYLEPCPVAITAVRDALGSTNGSYYCAGYVNACGTDAARRAIAAHPHNSGSHPDQVIVANGCSGALELALTALLDNETSILLVPQPGFPLYQVIAESHGARVVHYRLLPDQNWQMDLDHVREILQQYADGTDVGVIRGLVVNNPSNPTGAVYSRSHLRDICALCDEYHIPIVADEVYGDLVLDGHTFHPLARVAAELGRRVPVITASGIGKQYLLPGWRVGWIVFHDK
jgi:tyrosine aminotransferase